MTVGQCLDKYISNNENTLSPSTLKGYKTIRRTRFQKYMGKDVMEVDWQSAINKECKEVSPKSVANSWRLVTASMSAEGYDVPKVNLPKIPVAHKEWLDFEQIQVFLDALKERTEETDDAVTEIGALLALHGLRRSEVLDLDVSDIHDGKIWVRGAAVVNSDGELVHKDTNKNATSTRSVNIVIPRLLQLLEGREGKVITYHYQTLYKQINAICAKHDLPLVGVHGLRHSYISLCYHLKIPMLITMQQGGYSPNSNTCQKIYTHLAAQDIDESAEKLREYFVRNS